ncbi:MAG: undecaprenyl-diphosphate phosphatase [Actinomycetota bacterium]
MLRTTILNRRPSAGLAVLLGAGGVLVAGPVAALVAQTATEGNGTVDELSVFSAIVLGLVEGLTEYLPVSSTGHLLVTNEILGIGQTEETERALETYAICIQAGAIVAVFVLYWERIRQMLDGLLGRSEEGRRVLLAVIAAFIPTAIIGLFIVDTVRDNLFGVPPIAAAWLVGGVGILLLTRSGLMERAGLELGQITLRHAVLIGIAQAIAMWPGTSRSLITIVAGVLVGLSLRAAVEFSFLLGLATLSAATIVTALQEGDQLIELYGWTSPAIGLVVAFVAALASIKWMVSWLQERSLDIFGYYRIVIGLAAFAALALGWL